MGDYTPFAGLFEPAPGDDISANSYEFYRNVGIIDQMLQAALTRRYDGEDPVAAFASGPSLFAQASGGALSAGDTFWVGITAVDAYGGETIAMTASATVPGGVTNPTTGPTVEAINDSTGTMTAGTYRYVYTVVTDGGESEPSDAAEVMILTDGRIKITPPAEVTSSYDWRVYRAFGYSDLARVGSTHSAGTSFIIDDGESYTIYYDQQPPDENLTGETGKIVITRPTMPTNAIGWKVYAGVDRNLPSPALLSDLDDANELGVIPALIAGVDLVDVTQIAAGTPPLVSRTVGGGDNVSASNVDYGGSGSVSAGGMASGTVETSLDLLVGRTATMVRSIAPSGGVAASGDVLLVGSGNVSISASGRVITIFASGGTGGGTSGPSAYVASVNAASGGISIAGASGVAVSTSGQTVTIIGPTLPTIAASGNPQLGGNVKLVGASGVTLSQDSAGSAITMYGPAIPTIPLETTVRASGSTRLAGDVQLVAGTGINLAENAAASSITIESTGGGGGASAGVNSLKVSGGSIRQGDLVLYAGSGIQITTETDGFTINASGATGGGGGAPITLAASGNTGMVGDVKLVAGTAISLSQNAGASSITINGVPTTIAASGAAGASGDIVFVGSGLVSISQVGRIVTVYASAAAGGGGGMTQASADGLYVNVTGDTMSGNLTVNFTGSANNNPTMVAISSAGTGSDRPIIGAYRAAADAHPRVGMYVDSGGGGGLSFFTGTDNFLGKGNLFFDSGINSLRYDGSFAVQFDSGIKVASSNGILITGSTGGLDVTGLGGFIRATQVNGTTAKGLILRKYPFTNDTFWVTGSGTINWATQDVNYPQIMLGPQDLGYDTLVLDTTAAASGAKLVHGRHFITISSTGQTLATYGDVVYVDNSAGAITVNLPGSPRPGTTRTFKAKASTATNNITIGRNGKNIEGAGSDLVMSAGGLEKTTLQYDGTGWWVIG